MAEVLPDIFSQIMPSLPGRGEGTAFEHLHTAATAVGQMTAIFKGCIALIAFPSHRDSLGAGQQPSKLCIPP